MGFLEQRINERRHCGSLGQDDQCPQQNKHDDDGQKPKLLCFLKKPPELPHYGKFTHRCTPYRLESPKAGSLTKL